MPLVACPFCREMFEEGEAKACPLCGVELAKLEKLPLSDDAARLTDEDGVPRNPHEEPLPFGYLGRMRGVLAACAVVGLALFFLPWVHTTLPSVETYTGFDVGRQAGWTLGAGVAWFVLLPTILSRRSILQMRGARLAAVFLAAIPTLTTAILIFNPPTAGRRIPLAFAYQWPLYATLVLGVVTIVAAFGFGGRVDDVKVRRGTSAGQTLH
jgi:hypothetical protein